MSTLLFYKQRFEPPNKKSTPAKNAAHVEYIGSRPGVMREPNAKSGLFGVVDNQYKDVISLAEGRIRALQHSQRKMNVYRSIISFTEEQAQALQLNSLSAWKAYIKDQIPTIAAANNIKVIDMEWVAAIHQKDGHPHAHIAFWDKAQQIQVPFTKPSAIENLRGTLLKNTYPQIYEEFVQAKNAAQSDFRGLLKSEAQLYEDFLRSENVLEQLKEQIPEADVQLSNGLSIEDMSRQPYIANMLGLIYKLKEDMPAQGSMKYQLLSPDLKERVNEIVRLAFSDERVRRIVDRYISAKLDLKELYTSEEEKLLKAKDSYTNEAVKMFGNSILQVIKHINTEDFRTGEYEASFDQGDCTYAATSIIDILFQMSHLTRQCHAQISSLRAEADSKAARKEAAIKAKDKGLGVEY